MWRKLLKDAFQPSPEEAEEYLKERGIDIRSILESKVEEKLNQWKWDQRFLGMAQHVAQWSKDPSTQLGAVIVDDQNRIVSVGYNGFPAQIDDTEERLNHRETKYELTIHGEMNALLFANKPVVGCTLYTVPLPPCTRCAVTFIQAGIKRVVSPPVVGEQKARWDASIQRSADLFEEAGVTFDLMEITDE
jgi:dCMP deaminase